MAALNAAGAPRPSSAAFSTSITIDKDIYGLFKLIPCISKLHGTDFESGIGPDQIRISTRKSTTGGIIMPEVLNEG
jgi:hypothetical protein